MFRAQALRPHRAARATSCATSRPRRPPLDAERLIDELERRFSPEEARRQFETAVDWGRYAELFAYDDDTGEFFLEEEATR